MVFSGQGGIRTHETREGPPVFKTGAFNRSATCPRRRRRRRRRNERSHGMRGYGSAGSVGMRGCGDEEMRKPLLGEILSA